MTADIEYISEADSAFRANTLLGQGWLLVGFYTKAWDSQPGAQQVPVFVLGKPRNAAEG